MDEQARHSLSLEDRAVESLRLLSVTPQPASRTAIIASDPRAERFVSVPSIRRIEEAMIKNVVSRQSIAWERADFSNLTAKQVDAIQLVVSSLLYSEEHGGEVCGNLLNRSRYADISDAFAIQILDESYHSWLLARYVLDVMKRPIVKRPLITWLAVEQLKRLRDPLICTLAASFFVECAAAEVQSELIQKVDEPLLNQVFRLIFRDESRHQALGREAVLFLLQTPRYKNTWRTERARMYRHFLEFYSRITLNQYSKSASYFGISLKRIHERTLERVHEAVPL